MDDFAKIIGYFDTNMYLLQNDCNSDIPITQIQLSFNRKLENSDEFIEYIPENTEFSPDSLIHGILKKHILNTWDNKTIAFEGSNISKATLPVEYIDFIPTTENISKYILDKLTPIYKQYDLYLQEVTLIYKECNIQIIR